MSATVSITDDHFADIVAALRRADAHQTREDIDWSENIEPPATAEQFATDAVFVICNAGMKFTVARSIFERVMAALEAGHSSRVAFGHPGKTQAIDQIWRDRGRLFAEFKKASDPLAYCRSLPWIGPITCYHLAKNFGVDVAKPDVHLQRLARIGNETVDQLCSRLAASTGFRVATVDVLLWRASATGVIDSHTGALKHAAANVC